MAVCCAYRTLACRLRQTVATGGVASNERCIRHASPQSALRTDTQPGYELHQPREKSGTRRPSRRRCSSCACWLLWRRTPSERLRRGRTRAVRSYAGIGASVTGVGTVAWTNPGTSQMTTRAMRHALSSAAPYPTYLSATNFGFAIPADNIINGIQVSDHEAKQDSVSSPYIQDVVVSLIKGGAVTGNNKAATGTNWPTTMTSASYGRTSDLWGTTWTPADVNASNFGVVLSVQATPQHYSRTASVDYIQVTVTYPRHGEAHHRLGHDAGQRHHLRAELSRLYTLLGLSRRQQQRLRPGGRQHDLHPEEPQRSLLERLHLAGGAFPLAATNLATSGST